MNKPKTRDELRALYNELRKAANEVLMEECFPRKSRAYLSKFVAFKELCSPAMLLCLLDDLEVKP